MPNFYSPEGNYEVWESKPEGYFTEDEWLELHPPKEPEPQEPGVPFSISPRQARLALDEAGLLELAEEKLSQADKKAQIEWEYATSIERGSALIATFGSILGLSDEQIDELFITASRL